MLKGWKRHFKASEFSLEHHDPGRFVRGPWHPGTGPHITVAFLAYRIALMLLFLGPLIWSLIEYWQLGKWFIYLTHWGFLMCFVQATFGVFLVTGAFLQQRSTDPGASSFDTLGSGGQMPTSYKVYWLISNISVPIAFFISILYWTILYNPNSPNSDGTPFALNFFTHGANTILSFVELVVGGPPSKFLHFIQPLFFATLYITFNVIYWVAGGTDFKGDPWVYPVLNWQDNPGSGAAIVFGSAVLIIILHTFTCSLAAIRSHSAHKVRRRKTLGSAQLPTLTVGKFNKAFIGDAA